jgi:hypothetical protein
MANAGSDALLRIRELCVSACRQTGCNFVLDDVPVRSEKTVLETKNVDDDLSDRRVPRTPMVSLHNRCFLSLPSEFESGVEEQGSPALRLLPPSALNPIYVEGRSRLFTKLSLLRPSGWRWAESLGSS